MNLINELQKQYEIVMSWRHPHSNNFPLMNPFHVIMIVIAYIILVFIAIQYMKNREPLDMKTFSLIHNIGLVLLSFYMFTELVRQAIINNYTFFGNGIDPSPHGYGMARILWIFFISKIIEFIDTFIMIFKKNFRQVSFLHLYHHGTIFFVCWCFVYFGPGGDGYFSAAQNSLVHVIMYSYYILAALKIPFPLKPYITKLQMLQFILNMIQAIYGILHPNHPYPSYLAKLLFVYMITLLILFYNFHISDLKRRKNEQEKTKSD